MAKFLFQQGKFVVLENYKEYIVCNDKLDYKNHAHIKKGRDKQKTLGKVKNLIHMLEISMCPKSPYLRGSARRLLGHKGFEKLKKKQRYFNSQKGVRR